MPSTSASPHSATKKISLWLGASALALTVFLKITSELLEHEVNGIDVAILESIERARTPWLNTVAIDLTALGSITLVILFSLLFLYVLLIVNDKLGALQLATACIGAGILTILIKNFVDRPRPIEVTQLIHVSGFSYPSGHSLASASLYLTAAILLRRHLLEKRHRTMILIMAVTIIIFVGLSRLYLGVHYPSDVASGLSLGAAWAFLLTALFTYLTGRQDPVS